MMGTGVWKDAVVNPQTATWRKYTVTFAQLAAAALTNDVSLFSLASKEMIRSVIIKHSAAFSGGLIATYTLSVGIVGNLVKYAAAFDALQAAGDTVKGTTLVATPQPESFANATDIRVAAVSSVGNLDAATAGSADIWIEVSRLS
jgi:hypothetical protein